MKVASRKRSVLQVSLALAGAWCAAASLPSPLPAQELRERLGRIDEYLMPREQEVGLARSAGPRGIGDSATIWILGRRGYEIAEHGNNGFSCFVGRGWSGPLFLSREGRRVIHPEVFAPYLRAPHCFNQAAAETILPWHQARTQLLIAGKSLQEVEDSIALALQAGRLRAPGPGAMAYMTSAHQHLGRDFGSWRPHVMIYIPYLTPRDWGARGFSNDFPVVVESGTAWAVGIVQLGQFSDGTRPGAAAAP